MAVQVGQIVEGKIADIMNYGVFVTLEDGKNGLVHISEVSRDFVEDIHTVFQKGDIVKAKVIGIDEKGRVALSIKKALPPPERKRETGRSSREGYRKEQPVEGPASLEDMLSTFLKESDERQLYLKKNTDAKRGYSRRR